MNSVIYRTLLIIGVVYSLAFNDGRWVKEMYMPDYTFSVKDIPMFIIGALIIIYVIYVLVVWIKNKKIINNANLNFDEGSYIDNYSHL